MMTHVGKWKNCVRCLAVEKTIERVSRNSFRQWKEVTLLDTVTPLQPSDVSIQRKSLPLSLARSNTHTHTLSHCHKL